MKTTAYIGTSLDGFIARKDGEIDWLTQFENQEINQSYTEFINEIDAIVIGRGTFEKVLTFPTWFYQQKVFVLSTQIKEIPNNLKEKVTLLSMEPKELLHYLSNEGYSNIYVDGGKVIQSFLKENLLNELIITRVPVLIGKGIPLFGPLYKDLSFKHIQTKVYSNGLVKSHYERI
ncbi:MAG TPA: dihydrofolate reductase family protein [Flavobacterium sp.]|uniref:dihydrofolate reductase family protein n=1 Tax=Flavobacterium sp. TaxID=239 RepID=UPI002DB7ADF7|nr:dihydrofolate reductase family protein [Flavobacterium sp.]HEU4789190.1 dihydrofolate reductase family protein [Flavobacterium sp.]